MKIRQTLITLVAAALVAGLLISPSTLSAPAWDVWVADKNGHPVAGINVREVYQNYSAEVEDHEQTEVTDSSGHVYF